MWSARAWLLSCGALLALLVADGTGPGAERRPTRAHATSSLEAPPLAQERQSGPGPSAGTDALRQAATLVQQGRLEEAATQAKRALSDPGTRAAAHSVLGVIRFQQKQLPESVRQLREAIRLDPRLLGAHLNLAHVYSFQGETVRALELYRRVLELDGSNAAARLALARSEAETGNYERALELAAPVLPAIEASPEGVLVLAASYANTGRRAAAAGLASSWAQFNAPQASSVELAVVFLDAGLAAEAIRILEDARSAGSASFELAFNLGAAYLLNDEPARALDAYDLALSLEPESLPALKQAATVAEERRELERSLSYWIRAKEIAPEAPEILLGFGRVCLKMDLLEDAEPALERAASLKPGDTSYAYTLAVAKVGKRQLETAQALLEPLVKRQPDDPQLQYALGSVLYTRGRLDEAAARLRESVRLQPKQLLSHYYLALIARDRGDDAEAIERLQTLVQRYPEHAPSREALGGLLMSARRYDEAEASLRKAVALEPTSVKANYQLGLLLARMGRKSEADRQLALTKTLREEDHASSRLQLRLLDPEP